ncbi:MAG TPA: peptidylprolyl isomerase [Pelomicrobium sp.]|nr:peptidylprolyl isomerase [Pelomicrobium sp.]
MRIPTLRWPLAAALLAAASAACAQATAYGDAARVNGGGSSASALERSFNEYLRANDVNMGYLRNPASLKEMKQDVLNGLIDRELWWQAAQKAKVLASEQDIARKLDEVRGRFATEEDFRARLATEGYTPESYREQLKRLLSAEKYIAERVVAKVEVTDEDVHRFYVDNPDRMVRPEQVRARHILIKVRPGASAEQKAAARQRIEQAQARLAAGADFAEVAKEVSEDTSGRLGGDLGAFGRGQMVKPFEDAAFALAPGATSGIVETGYGYHLIRVEDKRGGDRVSEDEAREQIRAYLTRVRSRERVDKALAELRAKAEIEILLPL